MFNCRNLLIVVSFLLLGTIVRADNKNYSFDGSISEEVLLNYLSRSITMNGLSYSVYPEDDYRMIENIGAKLVGRVSYIWGAATDFPNHYGKVVSEDDLFEKAEQACKRLHEIDSEIIVQGDIFEIVDKSYTNSIKIPKRVFLEYGLEPVERNFRYEDMLYENGLHVNRWGDGASVPDMSQLETKMWFFYRATRYIDIGYESIHFGQCHLMDAMDTGHKNWWDTLTRIRAYAKKNARRHLVLCDSHTHGIVDDKGNLMYDFHSYPQRPVEIKGKPQEAHLVLGDRDSIYRRSKGGIAPSGWKCKNLPYIVEFDNTHTSHKEGQGGLGGCWVWGYEEVTWFAISGYKYRDYWLKYADNWIKENDSVGRLQMPGKIPMAIYHSGGQRMWYRANAISEGSPSGYGQEEIIKEIWTEK